MTQAFNLSQFANKVNTSGRADLTTAVTGVLPAANGGTGLSSPGTSGNVLQSNGSAWTSATIAIFSGNAGQVFTSSGTFTIPSGITKLKLTVVGGGGAGGGANSNLNAGGGGGGGGAAIKYLTGLTPGGTLAVTVGGAGGTSSVASGTQSITTVSATGGSTGGAVNSVANAGGSGGIGSNGDMNIKGQGGTFAVIERLSCSVESSCAGAGGSSIFGGGGRSQVAFGSGFNGEAGGAYGGGGGGAARWTTGVSGGAGAAGVVIFEW